MLYKKNTSYTHYLAEYLSLKMYTIIMFHNKHHTHNQSSIIEYVYIIIICFITNVTHTVVFASFSHSQKPYFSYCTYFQTVGSLMNSFEWRNVVVHYEKSITKHII